MHNTNTLQNSVLYLNSGRLQEALVGKKEQGVPKAPRGFGHTLCDSMVALSRAG